MRREGPVLAEKDRGAVSAPDYPDIKVELYSENGMRNIVEKRFDAGVRFGETRNCANDLLRRHLTCCHSGTDRSASGSTDAHDCSPLRLSLAAMAERISRFQRLLL
jgi:hypothetical protein